MAPSARLSLPVAPPFDLALTVATHRRAESNIVDRWEEGEYRRVFDPGRGPRLVRVRWNGEVERPEVEATIEGGPVGPEQIEWVRQRLTWILGLEEDLAGFYRFASGDQVLALITRALRGLRPPRSPSLFEALMAAFSAQQISLPFAIRLLGRLSQAYGESVMINGRQYLSFPTPRRLAGAGEGDLLAMQYSRNKADYILGVARAVASGELDLETISALDNEAALERLMAIRGIGRWTAEYLLMRALGRHDLFPSGDSGVAAAISRFYFGGRKATPAEIRDLAAGWGPWRGFVYFYLARAKRSL